MTKREAVINLKAYWLETITKLDSENGYFYPKVLINSNSIKGITIFPSELKVGKFFTEFIKYDYTPLNTQRTLYYIDFTKESLQNKYSLINTRIGEQYFIPITDLIEVKQEVVTTTLPRESLINIDDTSYIVNDDCNVDDLTARDWACIHLKVPKSTHDWLNDLIVESRRIS